MTLPVFAGMAPERLCLGCSLRVEELFTPLATGERSKLFKAAQKLLMFVCPPRRKQTSSWEDFFFCCIAELAIKPCRSSRSKLRGEFGIPNTCKTGNKNTTKQQTPPNPKHNTKQKTGKCLECETRGEKRVKRPKRPNALICRTPGGSMGYPLSSSLGMMLISHSVVSIPASPSRFAI